MNVYKFVYLIFVFLNLPFFAFSQLISFEDFYGNESTLDTFNDLQPDLNGGYVAVGESQDLNKLGEFYLTQFSVDGAILMEHKYGTIGIETANAIAVLDDRYIIGGSTFQDGEKTRDCYLIAVDFEGNLLNEITFGGNGDDVIYALKALENGNIAVGSVYEGGGTSGADINVRIYNSSLDLINEGHLTENHVQIPRFIVEDTATGNILVGGSSSSLGILVNFSADLETVTWMKKSDFISPIYYRFRGGIEFDENHYAIGTRRQIIKEAGFTLVDKITGDFIETIFFPELPVHEYEAIEIVKKDTILYFLLYRNGAKHFIKYDIIDESFSEVIDLSRLSSSIAVQENGHFGIAGFMPSFFYKIGTVWQYDENLIEEWSTSAGDFSDHSTEIGREVVEAEFGRMLLGGEIRRGSGLSDLKIQKINQDGSVVWETELSNGKNNTLSGITKTIDNGYLIANVYRQEGSSTDDLAFHKININGDLIWTKFIEQSDLVYFKGGNLLSNNDGTFYFSNTLRDSEVLEKIYILKLDEVGEIIWEKRIGLSQKRLKSNNNFIANNSDLIVAGVEDIAIGGLGKPLLMRFASNGDSIWQKTYDIPDFCDFFNGIEEDFEGNLYTSGNKGIVSKIDADGEILVPFIMETPDVNYFSKDICIAEDSSFYLLDLVSKPTDGIVLNNPLRETCLQIHHFDKDNNYIDSEIFGDGYGSSANQIMPHSNGGIAVFGAATKKNNLRGYLIRMDAESVSSSIHIQSQGSLTLSPTISDGNFSINLQSPHTSDLNIKIYHTNGQIVHQFKDKKIGEIWQKNVNLPDLAAGNYYVNIRLKDYAWTRQIVKN